MSLADVEFPESNPEAPDAEAAAIEADLLAGNVTLRDMIVTQGAHAFMEGVIATTLSKGWAKRASLMSDDFRAGYNYAAEAVLVVFQVLGAGLPAGDPNVVTEGQLAEMEAQTTEGTVTE